MSEHVDIEAIKARRGAILPDRRVAHADVFDTIEELTKGVSDWATNGPTPLAPFWIVYLPDDGERPRTMAVTGNGPTAEAHARFIAHAPEDIDALLAEVETLRAERDAERARAEQAEANYAFMVERAANEKLDGYRELGARAAAAETDRDAWKARAEARPDITREMAAAWHDGNTRAVDAVSRALREHAGKVT
jgi:hypothetical protein